MEHIVFIMNKTNSYTCTFKNVLYTLWYEVHSEIWPRANRAVVTNNSTMVIEIVLIEGFLYS